MNPSQQLNGYPTNVFANSSGQPVMYPQVGLHPMWEKWPSLCHTLVLLWAEAVSQNHVVIEKAINLKRERLEKRFVVVK